MANTGSKHLPAPTAFVAVVHAGNDDDDDAGDCAAEKTLSPVEENSSEGNVPSLKKMTERHGECMQPWKWAKGAAKG